MTAGGAVARAPRVLLELDAGEHADEPEELWALFDVLCVACGGHAGDAASMARLAALCARTGGPALGAHPSYPDRAGFGRRSLAAELSPAALAAAVEAQCAALAAAARAHGAVVAWLKPHGALYHDAAADAALAAAVLDGARAGLGGGAFTVIGPPRGALRDAAAARGLAYAREGFADRRRRPDGSLVPRGEAGALVTDPAVAAAQARELAAAGGVDALCVHADTPSALAIARAVRAALEADAGGGAEAGAGAGSREES